MATVQVGYTFTSTDDEPADIHQLADALREPLKDDMGSTAGFLSEAQALQMATQIVTTRNLCHAIERVQETLTFIAAAIATGESPVRK
jgi:hypothetical protein